MENQKLNSLYNKASIKIDLRKSIKNLFAKILHDFYIAK